MRYRHSGLTQIYGKHIGKHILFYWFNNSHLNIVIIINNNKSSDNIYVIEWLTGAKRLLAAWLGCSNHFCGSIHRRTPFRQENPYRRRGADAVASPAVYQLVSLLLLHDLERSILSLKKLTNHKNSPELWIWSGRQKYE